MAPRDHSEVSMLRILDQRLRPALGGLVVLAPMVLAACSGARPSNAPAVEAPTVLVSSSPSPVGPAASASPSLSGPVQIAQVEVTGSDAVILLQLLSGGAASSAVDMNGWTLTAGNTALPLP